jgi:hypothetical protein
MAGTDMNPSRIGRISLGNMNLYMDASLYLIPRW